ncbi:hypothetical protein [Brucella anthropi]|uniref:hypothetical protein n=1 Tax=Brucella anthropi TaxID=529 RepID=UPI0005BBE4DB|nr:hypothetical protein [Brucella anthropi]KIU69145.1 hypothetical protein TR92_07695 [Brucella anthropi]
MSIVLKLTAVKGKSPKRGFHHYWSVMMDFSLAERDFSARDIYELSNAPQSDINDFMRRLEKAKIIDATGAVDSRGSDLFRVIARQSETPKVRRDGTLVEGVSKQKAMWNYIRMAGPSGFTAQDISVWASTDNNQIALPTAKSYVKFLAKAGYLIELVKGRSGNLGVYRLAPKMNTGPLPPMVLRTKAVFDQNQHEIVGPVVTEEVQP